MYRIASHAHHRTVHDEIIILDTLSNAYLGLNGTAAVIWTALAKDGCVATAIVELMARFEVSNNVARTDVDALVAELLTRALIERADS